MKYIFLILLLTGCAKSSSEGEQSTVSSVKYINSVWSATYPNWTMDLSNFSGTQSFQINISYATGGSCTATGLVTAYADSEGKDDSAGTMMISLAAPAEQVSGMAPCTMFDGSWTYDALSTGMLMCQSGAQCIEFH